MADRNTKIRGSQIRDLTITVDDVDTNIQDAVNKRHAQDTDTILKTELGDVTDQSQLESTTEEYIDTDTSYDNAQTFQAGRSGELKSVELKIKRDNADQDLILELRSTSGGAPTASVLATESFAYTNFTNGVWETKTLTFSTPYTIVAGTTYAIVLRSTSVLSKTYWIGHKKYNPYANGGYYWTAAGAESWTFDGASYYRDFYFKTIVTIVDANFFNNGELVQDLGVSAGKRIGTKTIEEYQDAVDKKHDTITNEIPSGTINGTTSAFTLANSPITNTVSIFLNGLLQEPGAGKDYELSGTTVTFAAAPETNDILLASYCKD